MADIFQLPDLPRVRAFADRLRAADDEGATALLETEEGAWFFVEGAPYTDRETRGRLVKLIVARAPGVLLNPALV